MGEDFLKQTTLLKYSANQFERKQFSNIADIKFTEDADSVKWYNTYGINYLPEFNQVIEQNELDDFLIRLLREEDHPNKLIDLEEVLFVTIQVLKTEESSFDSDQMIFIFSLDFLWSIQEKKGDYFGWIRERLENNKGMGRKKKADYLLFQIIETIIDNYQKAFQDYSELRIDKIESSKVKPTPEFTAIIEKRKQNLFNFKKASNSLRDIIIKLEKADIEDIETKYFSELKEQANNLISDIDFELQELESKINLIFSIQGHRLNEVMKTLTIFSVIFIPLTFIAGVYGMNFKNMPELKTEYGYFILLGIMALITIISIWYYSKKKWF